MVNVGCGMLIKRKRKSYHASASTEESLTVMVIDNRHRQEAEASRQEASRQEAIRQAARAASGKRQAARAASASAVRSPKDVYRVACARASAMWQPLSSYLVCLYTKTHCKFTINGALAYVY